MQKKRFNKMKNLFLGLTICLELGRNQNLLSNQKATQVVLYKFKFKSDGSSDQLKNLKNEILKQKSIIAGLIDISFEEDFPSIEKGFTNAEIGEFGDRKSLRVFNKSDDHQELNTCYSKPVLEEILVFDYETKNGFNFLE